MRWCEDDPWHQHERAQVQPETNMRTRVLLIAEACNPTWTSVPLVGYQLAKALAARPDLEVTLATHVRNRPALAEDTLSDLARVCYVDNEWLAKPLHRLSRLVRGGQGLSWTIDTAMAWPAYMAFGATSSIGILSESCRGAIST